MPSTNHSGRQRHALQVADRDVVLERVDQLVADHVIGFGEAGAGGQHDAAAQAFGDAAGAFAHQRGDDVGLLEVRMAGVEHERLPAAEMMIEHARQAGVPALRHARHVIGERLLFFVVIDVEVLGLERLEVEGVVLDLVPSEVLRFGGRDASRQTRYRKQQDPDPGSNHWCTPGSSLLRDPSRRIRI